MNAKLCKKLRREARDLTVGLPARRRVWTTAMTKKGKRLEQGFVVNDRNSTRGVYRLLKKQVRA